MIVHVGAVPACLPPSPLSVSILQCVLYSYFTPAIGPAMCHYHRSDIVSLVHLLTKTEQPYACIAETKADVVRISGQYAQIEGTRNSQSTILLCS